MTKSSIPQVRHVYRVPTKEVYRKKHGDGDPTWQDVYGRARCYACHQLFTEGDAYESDPKSTGEFRHAECPRQV
jgi:hypothetical protein